MFPVYAGVILELKTLELNYKVVFPVYAGVILFIHIAFVGII